MNKKLSMAIVALLVALMMVGSVFTAALAESAATDTDTATQVPATNTDTATQAPATAPTEAPTTAPTAAPTKAPTVNTNTTTAAGAAATVEEDDEPAAIQFSVDEFLAALGLDAANVTVTEDATVITLDEATGTYGGSVLIYATGDIKALILISTYDAEVILTFADWRASITDVDALNASDEFAEFVKYAKSILGDMDEEAKEALIVAILNSDAEGIEMDEDVLALFFGEGVTGEVLGVYEQDGIEYCLLETETSIILGVRAI